ncbi:hypothetical protein AXG93_606s1330 [Marchantia polymorpha subsp. ruderalis]|uniref:Uncharacterized protein n=1 Tax=Marchantia polymorpha subsp. ruderalis TaxID=1480154 RepID=A0A176VKH1_MARPO|nr:hypothetical protein AXG93_606s1330 [Marchantia polymorpha subsp. ruderalis]
MKTKGWNRWRSSIAASPTDRVRKEWPQGQFSDCGAGEEEEESSSEDASKRVYLEPMRIRLDRGGYGSDTAPSSSVISTEQSIMYFSPFPRLPFTSAVPPSPSISICIALNSDVYKVSRVVLPFLTSDTLALVFQALQA